MRNRHRRTEINLANALSALRFPLALLFPLTEGLGARGTLLVLAAASDWIDGPLARASGRVTRAGELLDPIADKTFMVAALVTLGVEGRLPLWTLPLLLTRDIGVGAGALALAARGVRRRMPARRAGKMVTWLQFTAIGAIVLRPRAAGWVAPVVSAAGLVALHDYARALRSSPVDAARGPQP